MKAINFLTLFICLKNIFLFKYSTGKNLRNILFYYLEEREFFLQINENISVIYIHFLNLKEKK